MLLLLYNYNIKNVIICDFVEICFGVMCFKVCFVISMIFICLCIIFRGDSIFILYCLVKCWVVWVG